MNPPFWKKWLSYIYEISIENRSSEHNPYLQVNLVRGRYQLFTENAIYSFADLYSNFRRAFQQIDLDRYPIEKVLVLGYGMASIPYMLEKVYRKRYEYVGVDIDEEVLDLANKYVLPELRSPQQLICGDAYNFVQICQEKFDLIAVDLFLDDVIPAKFETLEFLELLAGILKPEGLLLYNRLADAPNDRDNTLRFSEEKFCKVFENGRYLKVGRNWVLVNR